MVYEEKKDRVNDDILKIKEKRDKKLKEEEEWKMRLT